MSIRKKEKLRQLKDHSLPNRLYLPYALCDMVECISSLYWISIWENVS